MQMVQPFMWATLRLESNPWHWFVAWTTFSSVTRYIALQCTFDKHNGHACKTRLDRHVIHIPETWRPRILHSPKCTQRPLVVAIKCWPFTNRYGPSTSLPRTGGALRALGLGRIPLGSQMTSISVDGEYSASGSVGVATPNISRLLLDATCPIISGAFLSTTNELAFLSLNAAESEELTGESPTPKKASSSHCCKTGSQTGSLNSSDMLDCYNYGIL